MKCRSGGKQLSPNDHVFQLPTHVLLPYKCWQCAALLPYLPRCSTLHPKKNLTGVLKTTPWIYFAKWDKAGCDKKNNLLVCTALMSSLCFSFCAKYLMFNDDNDGFLRKISAHCQAGVSSKQVFIWPLWLWRGTSAHQRDIIGLTMVIPREGFRGVASVATAIPLLQIMFHKTVVLKWPKIPKVQIPQNPNIPKARLPKGPNA